MSRFTLFADFFVCEVGVFNIDFGVLLMDCSGVDSICELLAIGERDFCRDINAAIAAI